MNGLIVIVKSDNESYEYWSVLNPSQYNYSNFLVDMAERMLLDRSVSYIQWERQGVLYRLIREIDKTKFKIS